MAVVIFEMLSGAWLPWRFASYAQHCCTMSEMLPTSKRILSTNTKCPNEFTKYDPKNSSSRIYAYVSKKKSMT
jgi:hypothetical protein